MKYFNVSVQMADIDERTNLEEQERDPQLAGKARGVRTSIAGIR